MMTRDFWFLSAEVIGAYVAPIRSLPSTRVLTNRPALWRHFGDGVPRVFLLLSKGDNGINTRRFGGQQIAGY